MAMLKKKSKVSDEIPSAGMADIAFLLLIFFLVTTIFPQDEGLQMILPEEGEEEEVPEDNILHLGVQTDGTVEVRRGESEDVQTVLPHEVEAIWRMEVAENPELIANISVHPDAEHQYMTQTLDALQVAGSTRISLSMDTGG